LDDASQTGASVQQHPASGWLVRAGLRVKSRLATGLGILKPYAR
jgi:hypothetical protein